MQKHEGREGSDLFQEIQDKVDREMFRETEEPDAGVTNAPTLTPEETSATSPDAGEFEVVVDVIDPDAAETEVEAVFLEEVDYIPPEGDTYEVLPLEVSSPVEAVSTDPTPQEVSPAKPEETFVQEDDLFLGELIGREMVGTAGAEETSDGSDESEAEVSSFGKETDAGDEDVLNTRTLADLYADQGHFDQAVEIYERLVLDHPEDEDLQTGLEGVREKLRTALSGVPVAAAGTGEWGDRSGEVKTERIERLESWLARIQTEKERRCLKSS